jgi:tripartite-type tricarboxylate transporter receptor subunit TctC
MRKSLLLKSGLFKSWLFKSRLLKSWLFKSWPSTTCDFAPWLAAAIAFVAASHAAVAQSNWPTQNVRVLAPLAAGSTGDRLTRILADHMSTVFGTTFVVENGRTGTGGMVTTQRVVTAAPDGHTLLISGIAPNIVTPNFVDNAPYDGLKDFTHIAFLGGSPVGLLIHPSLPVNSYAELVTYLKSNDPMNYTSSGIGTNGFLFGEELSTKEGLRLNHIPYKGGAVAVSDLIAGHVKIATMTYGTAAANVRAGQLKALAVSSENRLASFPEIPTFKEVGYPVVSLSWFSISGPKGLPQDIAERINRETQVAVQKPEVKDILDRNAIEIKLMSLAETQKYFEDEYARWAPLARSLRGKGNQN